MTHTFPTINERLVLLVEVDSSTNNAKFLASVFICIAVNGAKVMVPGGRFCPARGPE